MREGAVATITAGVIVWGLSILRPTRMEEEQSSHLPLTKGMLALIVGAVVIAILIAPNDLPPKENKEGGGSRGRSA